MSDRVRWDGRFAGDSQDLVFSLCHEVGNLLAATSLQAHLIGSGATQEEIDLASLTLVGAALRGGSLLALIRPLLAPETVGAQAIDPLSALERIPHSVDSRDAERLEVDLKSASGLPRAWIDAELLHHLLLIEIQGQLGASSAPVRVEVERAEDSLVFRLIHQEISEETDAEPELVGRLLTRVRAQEILSRHGGCVELERRADTTRIDFRVPLALG